MPYGRHSLCVASGSKDSSYPRYRLVLATSSSEAPLLVRCELCLINLVAAAQENETLGTSQMLSAEITGTVSRIAHR
jgi:hypothetical protein